MSCVRPGFRARWRNFVLAALGIVSLVCGGRSFAQGNVLTFHNDNARTGQYLVETNLTLTNVNVNTFGLLFAQPVDGQIYGQPLSIAGVTIPNAGVHNVIIVATENDSVYAFDADNNSGANAAPLWQDSFINPAAGITTVPSSDVNSGVITPSLGITSTPVIDPSSSTVYVEVKTKEVTSTSTNWVHRLHALDLGTGAEKFGGPVVISPVSSGVGDGNDGQGHVPFNGLRQLNRPALLLQNGVVYLAFGSQGDTSPYHGWLLGYNAQTLQPQGIFNATPNGGMGAIWEGGDGPAADSNGAIYVVTGNGSFDGATNGDYGDSFLKINVSGSSLTLGDYFTPSNQQALSSADLDVGAGGLVVLPDAVGSAGVPHLAVAGSKQGTLYVVNRDNLGEFNAATNKIVQSLGGFSGIYSTPAYYNGMLYLIATGGPLQAYACTNGALATPPASTGPEAYGFPGATPSVSANGTSNAIVWAVQTSSPAILRAYNATNVEQEIYNSQQAGARDTLGTGVKFVAPTVAHGKVYVGTAGSLAVFGNGVWATPSPIVTPAGGIFTNSQTVTLSDVMAGVSIYYTTDGSTPTASSPLYAAPFQVTSATLVNALAVAAGNANSDVSSALFLPFTESSVIADFGEDGDGWSLNGGTAVRYNVATLTDGNGNEARSLYYNEPVNVTAFNAQFVYQSTGGADGAAFVLQNSSAGSAALGGYGGCLAYCGTTPSMAVELNLYGGSGTVIATDGSTGGYVSTSPVDLDSGDPIWVAINYDGSQLTEELTDLSTGAAFGTNTALDIPAAVGGTNAYVGFTGADGGVLSVQTISEFVYTVNNLPAPPPDILPDGAIFTNAIAVTLTTSVPDGQVYYTLNGTPPTTNSLVTMGPLYLTNTTGLSAMAAAPGSPAGATAYAFFGDVAAGASISGFSAPQWSFNGGASEAADALTLTDGNGGEARSAFYGLVQEITNFIVRFVYQSGGGADGTAFVIQNSPDGATAVGVDGGCLGYCGISNSAAVEFNLYSGNGGTGTRFATNGATEGYASTLPVNLGSGDPIWVTLFYDGSTLTEQLVDQQNGETYGASYPIDLTSVVGATTALVGFTGGDGGLASVQTVSGFSFAPSPPPTCVSAALAGNNLVVTWQTNFLNYTLEYTTNLSPPAQWRPVPQSPVLSAGRATLVLPVNSTNTFYRLVAP